MAAEVDLLDNDEVLLRELGSGAAHRRDWRGIGTALLVIFIICLLIFLCGYIFTPLGSLNNGTEREMLNLTDIKRFRPTNSFPEWLKDGRMIFENEEGLHVMGMDSENVTTVVTYKEIHDLLQRGGSVQCSFDCSLVSVTYASENPSINPDNESLNAFVFDLKTRALSRISKSSGQSETIRFLLWSPLENDFIFAEGGHLFYVDKVGNTPVSITSGDEKKIHGVFDWVTDEEIFASRQAVWWSRDGHKLAFASKEINDDHKAITLTAYKGSEKYQIDSKLVYPKSGERDLPIWTLSIWDKNTRTTRTMDVQLTESREFHYLFGVSWVRMGDREQLISVWANRWQNHTSVTLCDFETSICNLIFEHAYPAKMWALPDEYKNVIGGKDSSLFLILPRQMPDGNSYQHVARIRTQGGMKQFLSMGTFDVKNVIYHDEENELLYFTAMAPRPSNIHLFVTKATSSTEDVFHCVSCSLKNCSFVVPSFSSDGKRVSLVCRGPSFPRNFLAELTKEGDLRNVREVLHDKRLEQLVENTNLPVTIREEITLSNGFVATVRIIKPQTRQLTGALPLLVYVYNGPAYQINEETFSVTWMDYLATNLNIAVARIDARGTGGRGWKYRSPIYGGLGTVEMEDQVEAVRLILQKHPYFDPNRVALHGWSYGGFATLRMVEIAPTGLFKCAISGAPVTNFQYYDATYSERYMGAAPREAYVDVNKGDLSKFRSTRLLLIHGLSDDNVHFQNSAVFSEAMQVNHIDFDFMVYSNERHHLTGEKWIHGYTLMTSFLRECLSSK